MVLRDPEILRRLGRKNRIVSGLIRQLESEMQYTHLSRADYEDLAIAFNDLASFAFDQAEKPLTSHDQHSVADYTIFGGTNNFSAEAWAQPKAS